MAEKMSETLEKFERTYQRLFCSSEVEEELTKKLIDMIGEKATWESLSDEQAEELTASMEKLVAEGRASWAKGGG